jgi:hypothetical protein
MRARTSPPIALPERNCIVLNLLLINALVRHSLTRIVLQAGRSPREP